MLPAVSPRKRLTAAEKNAKDGHYVVTPRDFNIKLKKMAKEFNALVDLSLAIGSLSQAGKGAYLAFPDPNNPQGPKIPFTRKQLRSSRAQFHKSILDLGNYFKYAKKKHRERAKPEEFKGVYTPVYAGEALQAFFNGGIDPNIRDGGVGFGSSSPLQAIQTGQAGVALMDLLPMAKAGFIQRNTITMLFFIYAHQQNLQNPENAQTARSDALMNEVFGGTLAAEFFSEKVDNGVDKNGKPKFKTFKYRMNDAIDKGLIERPLNTYEVIQRSHPDFDPNGYFPNYLYQNIASNNYFNKAALEDDPNFANIANLLQEPDRRQEMLNELRIVERVSDEWSEILEPGRKEQRLARKQQNEAAKRAERQLQQQ